MADAEDNWPEPKYSVGPRQHLHAVGVISVSYNAFETGLFDLYLHHLIIRKLPEKLVDIYYHSLNENAKLSAIKVVFETYEKNVSIISKIKSIVSYFEWCSDARNKLLHSEAYPAFLGGDADKLYLSKRHPKSDTGTSYLTLKLDELRSIADKIDVGKKYCAELRIRLRLRDTPSDRRLLTEKLGLPDELPDTLVIPPKLDLLPKPGFNNPLPRRKASRK